MAFLDPGGRQNVLLLSGRVLSVTSIDAIGSITRLGDREGDPQLGYAAIAEGETKTFGPFAINTRHTLVSFAGTIEFDMLDAADLLAAAERRGSRIIRESGTALTLGSIHAGAFIYFTNGGAITLTVPLGLGAGFECGIIQGGAGQVTMAPAEGTTINPYTKTASQYSTVGLVAPLADIFISTGDGA